jgi:hypothetical protein
MASSRRWIAAVPLLLAVSASGGCTEAAGATADDDLTSRTARARSLTFEGRLYVDEGTDEQAIRGAVDVQARTAFGPLRTADLSVATRELKAVGLAAISKRSVFVVAEDGTRTPKIEVRYTYADEAVAGPRHDGASSVSLALLASQSYATQTDRILRECTANDDLARKLSDKLWYVFDPSLPSCQAAMAAEQASIERARSALADPEHEIAGREADRLYLPVLAKLGPDETNKRASWPEYHRLFAGGVAKDRLVASVIQGLVAHELSGSPSSDYGWGEYMDILGELFAVHPTMKVARAEPEVDLSTFALSSGNTVKNVRLSDIVSWVRHDSFPSALSTTEKKELEALASERLYRHWITLELPVDVAIGDAAPRSFTIEVNAFFGAGEEAEPYRRAVRSDVFFYAGHSYIGSGPLDPSRFVAEDLSPSYQLFFVNGCVSYNYYRGGFIPLKQAGTKDLDLVTNGLETPIAKSGHAMGRMLARLLDGTNASYDELLQAAEATDTLRVVDGELDNDFSPETHAIRMTPR